MRISGLIVLCLLVGSSAYAQNKKESKLYQFFEQKNYSKLEKKSKKLLTKDRKNIYANYFMSEIYLHRYNTVKSVGSKKSSISKSIKYISKVDVSERPEFKITLDSLHQIISSNAQDSSMKKNINDQYRNWLLVYFEEQVPPFHITEVKTRNIVVLDSARISDSLRYTMLKKAQKLKGVKYVYAGTSPTKGFDCSGFTQYVYKQVGIEIPHNAQMQSNLTTKRTDLKNLKPGDLVFFGSWNGSKQRTIHAGIIFDKRGDEITVIHCVSGGVSIEGKDSSWDRYWIDRVLFGISLDALAKN